MVEVLTRAGCFVAIIAMGYLLRRIGFFKEGDFQVLSRIVLRITLPASIVSSFAGMEIDVSMLFISLLGLGFGAIYIVLAFLLNVRSSRERRAFDILNFSGYNIGNFTMPFVQSFLGPAGAVATSLFDTGNAFVCLGGAYSIASMVKGEGGKFSIVRILKTLVRSVPFDTYIIMITLALLHVTPPQPVVELANIIGQSNAFMAMLMIGVGFKLSGEPEQRSAIARILIVRYGVAAVLACVCYFVLPLALEHRQALTLLCFGPIASAVPAFTADIKGDVGLSSAVNSFSIVISIGCIVGLLLIML